MVSMVKKALTFTVIEFATKLFVVPVTQLFTALDPIFSPELLYSKKTILVVIPLKLGMVYFKVYEVVDRLSASSLEQELSMNIENKRIGNALISFFMMLYFRFVKS
jgi:hypothetical protein